MPSKAEKWVKTREEQLHGPRLQLSGGATAGVYPLGEQALFHLGFVDCGAFFDKRRELYLIPTDALRLAAWIQDTFSEREEKDAGK